MDMKKITLIMVMALMTLTGYAQTEAAGTKFGYLSVEAVMQTMPEYAKMLDDLALLRSKYDAEQKRVEDDFNKKYEEFLDGLSGFPKTILQKRQIELQEMLDKNIAFKQESQQLLGNAEQQMRSEVEQRVNAALLTIGAERGYAFILNTDKGAVPFVNPALGEDITNDVKALLQKQ